MTEPKQNSTIISEGIILAFIPFLGYMISFIYEKGYADVFQYPISFISISIESILISSFTVFSFLLLLYFIVDRIVGVLDKNKIENTLIIFVFVYTISFSSLGLLLYMSEADWFAWLIYFTFFISDFILELLIPFIRREKGEKYSQKFAEYRKSTPTLKTLTTRLLDKSTPSIAAIILIIIVLYISSYAIGKFSARHTEYFYTVNGNKELLVLRINNTRLIVGKIDTTNNVIQSYSIEDMSKTNISIKSKKIGIIKTSIPIKADTIKTSVDNKK